MSTLRARVVLTRNPNPTVMLAASWLVWKEQLIFLLQDIDWFVVFPLFSNWITAFLALSAFSWYWLTKTEHLNGYETFDGFCSLWRWTGCSENKKQWLAWALSRLRIFPEKKSPTEGMKNFPRISSLRHSSFRLTASSENGSIKSP